jgi:hypothetical protein
MFKHLTLVAALIFSSSALADDFQMTYEFHPMATVERAFDGADVIGLRLGMTASSVVTALKKWQFEKTGTDTSSVLVFDNPVQGVTVTVPDNNYVRREIWTRVAPDSTERLVAVYGSPLTNNVVMQIQREVIYTKNFPDEGSMIDAIKEKYGKPADENRVTDESGSSWGGWRFIYQWKEPNKYLELTIASKNNMVTKVSTNFYDRQMADQQEKDIRSQLDYLSEKTVQFKKGTPQSPDL